MQRVQIFQKNAPNRFVLLMAILFLGLVACLNEEPEAETPLPPTATETAPTAVPTDVPPTEAPPTAEPIPTAVSPIQSEGVFISELLVGVVGNNNQEFVELYNAGDTAVSLQGYSLSYLLNEGQDETVVYAWNTAVDIPPFGHFLLLREGQAFEIIADAFYDTALFERKGGLILRDGSGEVVDRLGWGSDAPPSSVEGAPSLFPSNSESIERLPGGEAGNGQDSDNNEADFALNVSPNPQNSGSATTPALANSLGISLIVPELIPPGEQFNYEVQIVNETENTTAVSVSLPIASHFELIEAPAGSVLESGRLTWTIADVEPGITAVSFITLQSPFSYTDALVTSYYAEAAGLVRAYGPPTVAKMGGGAVPIAIARDLVGSVVTVEGVATMYTGGFFAGSSNTKFYIQDDTGGIQIFADDGRDTVTADVGEKYRVTGEIVIFRDSIELIPLNNGTDIELIGTEEVPAPTIITASDNENDDSLLGKLTQLEGTAIRVEEFNFSYEIDILDDAGDTTLILIEKDTGATAETFTEGTRYMVTGITELASGRRQLKPRFQTDLREIFPPILLLSQQGPVQADPGNELEYVISVVNHSPNPMTKIEVGTPTVTTNGSVIEISDDGAVVGDKILWTIDELAGDGAEFQLSYKVQVADDAVGSIVVGPITAVADQWPDPATTAEFLTFVGDSGVPIWAIQGNEDRSPYLQSTVTTSGIVTGVFPELDGFWIQEQNGDNNPNTSDGLFVFTDQMILNLVEGDLVEVTAAVREISGQTALAPTSPSDMVVMSSDNALPAVQIYDPPEDPGEALLYNESLEGMLVSIEETAVVIAPTTRFGEFTAVYEKWGVDQVARTDEVGYLMFVDDGSTVAHNGRSSLPFAVKSGDQISGLVGPLAYTFGNYKIAPLTTPEIVEQPTVIPLFPVLEDDQLGIVTFNVENLFDFLAPHPSSPDLPLPREYRAKLGRIAESIQLMGYPTVIGLQEVESLEVLEDLVEHELLAEFGYAPYLIEGFDSRGIDVGYIVRSDQATVELASIEGAPDTLFSRPPLLLQITLLANGQTIYLLNNHFLSLSAGEVATEPTRTAQAQWNADLVSRLMNDDPTAEFVVLGDLNSFYQTPPIIVLQEVGLRHVYEFVEGDLPYTYIFEGRTQTLDHILLSEGLFAQLELVTPVHINADYPIADADTEDIPRISDHDPLMVVISIE
ncbi:MAG: lamin tail domain-containing protein [Chloroflexota bacterium]